VSLPQSNFHLSGLIMLVLISFLGLRGVSMLTHFLTRERTRSLRSLILPGQSFSQMH
jgi:hypothetical protein